MSSTSFDIKSQGYLAIKGICTNARPEDIFSDQGYLTKVSCAPMQDQERIGRKSRSHCLVRVDSRGKRGSMTLSEETVLSSQASHVCLRQTIFLSFAGQVLSDFLMLMLPHYC